MMIEVVKVLPPEILEDVELIVWNVTTLEGFNRKKELKAIVPSLYINGQVAFNTGMPNRKQVLAKIQELLLDPNQGK